MLLVGINIKKNSSSVLGEPMLLHSTTQASVDQTTKPRSIPLKTKSFSVFNFEYLIISPILPGNLKFLSMAFFLPLVWSVDTNFLLCLGHYDFFPVVVGNYLSGTFNLSSGMYGGGHLLVRTGAGVCAIILHQGDSHMHRCFIVIRQCTLQLQIQKN